MSGLYLKGVVVGGEVGVGSRAPLHLDGEARRVCFGAISAAEVYGISAARQSSTGDGPSQTGEEDLVVPGHRHGGHPCIRDRVEGGGGAGSAG